MCTVKCFWHGAVAGIIAGIVFAIFLYMGGMLEMLGGMVNMPTKAGGILVHAVVSIISGIVFAFIFGWWITSWLWAIVLGLVFGIGMWIAGPMTLLPYFAADEPLFSKWNLAAVQQNIPPLVGHIIYGFVLGIAYYALKKTPK